MFARSPLRCFLSYRFSPRNEAVALKLVHFLGLLGVKVSTGSGYEPRRISEKVMAKLKEPLDFILLLVAKDGESMWTRDEIAAALHQGIALIPVVEKGASFAEGLFGDVEWIHYSPGHIGDALAKITEAVRFIERAKEETLLAMKGQAARARVGT